MALLPFGSPPFKIVQANTAFVSTGGNDSTGKLGYPNKPFLTVAGAMASITNPAILSLIQIQNPGAYSVDGLVLRVNVFIQGPDPASTVLDFGNAGITIDTSWNQAGNNIGGITNLGMTSSGSVSALTFDFSAVSGNNSFNFNNVQMPGNLPLNLLSSNTNDQVTFNIVNAIQNKGPLTISDSFALVSGYFNENDGLVINTTGVHDSIVYSTTSSYFGNVNLSTVLEGRAILLLASGSIFGTIDLADANCLLEAQMGTLPAASNITNSGGTIFYGGDAVQVPYFPATPSDWTVIPQNVSVALDDLAAAGYLTAISVVTANGFAGASSGGPTPALTLSTTVTGILQGDGTAISAAPVTGSGAVVLAMTPTLSNPIVGTQAQGNDSTTAASTAYVDTAVANAVAGINPAVAVQAATTASSNTAGFTYNNGVSGVGATLTDNTINSPLTVDGYTFTAIGQRLLVKNDTQSPSGAFNGIYSVTQLQTSLLPVILTRALDYDTPSDINNTGAIPVINGTVNGTTLWVETAQVNTIGTDPLVFTQFGAHPGPSSGLYDFVVGPTQTYTTISAAITAATAGQSIFIQTGTYTENVILNKQLNITGSGRGVVINGSLEFATGSDDSLVQMVKVASGITIDAGVSEIQLVSFWNASGQTITDNGTGSFIQGMQE